MSLNSTPQSVRVHIGLFGKRNAGKSSIINAISNQEISIVSDIAGTTTDPVFRPIEILPIGPCVLIDTAGFDDVGSLGQLRINKSLDILSKTDIALLVVDSTIGISKDDLSLIESFKSKNIPHILVLNKIDALNNNSQQIKNNLVNCPIVSISAKDRVGIESLKKEIINTIPKEFNNFSLLGDLIKPGDFIVLIIPIDKAAPKGRLILPQQQVIRDILDSGAIAIITKEDSLNEILSNLSSKPKLIITDSQVFKKVNELSPPDIPLTSFSILFARAKGDLDELVKGCEAIDKLKNGDKILIAEGCTHHRQDDDIGTFKIPNMIKNKTNKNITFDFASGISFSNDLSKYALVVHCGACMMNKNAMLSRIQTCRELDIPIVNYGVLMAYANNILDKTLKPFNL
ncbi:MAG: [FeFe] hydrogenase H-cluster maturation GTPase HydF [Romboutsia sp.]|uniref:[FeFe] hydrogenase H-cluster maturation GTPase HydF n=1 Tax=Romboutsia sp. TaxID=1965302 RepID=UPI003F29FB1B